MTYTFKRPFSPVYVVTKPLATDADIPDDLDERAAFAETRFGLTGPTVRAFLRTHDLRDDDTRTCLCLAVQNMWARGVPDPWAYVIDGVLAGASLERQLKWVESFYYGPDREPSNGPLDTPADDQRRWAPPF